MNNVLKKIQFIPFLLAISPILALLNKGFSVFLVYEYYLPIFVMIICYFLTRNVLADPAKKTVTVRKDDVKYILLTVVLPIAIVLIIAMMPWTAETTARCQFKRNGERVCNAKATHGNLCEYHFRMLDDIYNDLIGG